MLITIAEAREHLRTDEGADDAWITLMIPAVSEAVMLWLKDRKRAFEVEVDPFGNVITDSNGDPVFVTDSSGSPVVRPVVRAAVLQELGSQYIHREGNDIAELPSHWGHGHTLSLGATKLLTTLRKPTIA